MSILRPLLRDDRGTASIEAAVMLPFFILCWAGLLYVYHGHEAKLAAGVDARHCAWAYSNGGCRVLPEGCRRLSTAEIEQDGQSGDWLAALDGIPVISGLAESIFGEVATVGHDITVDRPPLFGGGTVDASGTYTIMCNEERRDLGDVLQQTLCDQLETIGMDAGFMGC